MTLRDRVVEARLANPQPTGRGPVHLNQDRGIREGDRGTGYPERPSHQTWRPTGPDEVLQPGSHVRVNVQTGKARVR
jgi:hypothetical protein